MNKADKYLKNTLKELIASECFDKNVRPKYKDGEEANTRFLTHRFFEYDLTKNEFPIPSLRKVAVKTGIREVLWIYQKQSSHLRVAEEMKIKWWDSWDIGDETIGLRYGETVRRYDIINSILKDLETNKFSRRHIIDLYQYQDFKDSRGLYPCAFLSMFSVREIEGVNYLDLMLVLRSSDFIVAGFINKIQYVALQMMLVGHLNYETNEKWEIGKFSCAINNLHLYLRHQDQAKEILNRESIAQQPTIKLKENKNFYDYTIDDFEFNIPKGVKKLTKPLELAV